MSDIETPIADHRPEPSALARVLGPLASLKLTVVLFALAIVIVLAGTLAQVNADVWDVVDEYFRIRPSQLAEGGAGFLKAFFVWIPGQIFLPGAFFPNAPTLPEWAGFWFPKGWVIGGVMLLNLLSAHLIRFKLQARGTRLVVGLWLLAMGVLVTWLVVASGSNNDGFQTETLISYRRLWDVLLFGLFGLSAGSFYLGLRTGPAFKMERRLAFGAAASLGAMFAWLLLGGIELWKSDASMRILYQLVKGIVAGAVLLAGCQALFKKRAGIVLLHGGVALLMMSEVLVGLKAVETKMNLGEGETRNFVFDTRHPEIAIIDASDPTTDTVTVVPLSKLLEPGAKVSDDLLPFNIESVKVLKNSLVPPALAPDKDNPATAGAGLTRQLREIPASTGVSNDSSVDLPGLYVKLTDKKTGADLGTWMTHVFEDPQTVKVDGKSYELQLRFGQTYLPFSIKLVNVAKDDYLGTKTTRNYSSEIVLADAEKNTKDNLTIWMNNPLRYRGLTFYQSGYHRDERSGREFTTLQVVSNTGWMIPYVSCMIVGVGMAYQFMLTLLRFLNRSGRMTTTTLENGPVVVGKKRPVEAGQSTGFAKWLPLAIAVLAALYIGSKARPYTSRPGEMDIAAFAKLPLAYEGRVKPFDTLARNTMLILSGKQEYRDTDGKKQPAIRWLLDVISGRPEARESRVFRITNLELLKILKLEPREGFVYAVNDFADKMPEFVKALESIENVPKESLTVYQRSIRDLGQDIMLYRTLMEAFDPPIPELPTEEDRAKDPEAASQKFVRAIMGAMEESKRIEDSQVPLSIPIPEAENSAETKTTGQWQPFATSFARAFLLAQLPPEMRKGLPSEPPKQTLLMQEMLSAYRQGNASKFNDAVREYTGWLKSHKFEQLNMSKVRFEEFFNQFAPFYWSMVLCLFVFVLSIVGWLGLTEPLRRGAFWLMALTFAIHTFALVARIYISGRPPVTNLYSTGIFIGWAVVLFGLACEWFYRLGVGNAVASIAGFITLGISHFLAEGGDTFTVLEAVLDTQFWLATHVVTINLGYAATAAAGLFGVYHILYSLVPSARPDVGKAVTRMTYGSLCFAILFSFIGTVLGGLWADDSWGRFWGWDPKENGALIIVLWNCLVLHAKWDGMIKDRGLAVLSTLGLIAVSWSWFGTNQLGAGLHAYGFTNAARIGLFVCWAVSLVIAGLGCLGRKSQI
jgi:ABC-type transport system involved in cytochrome c biogenesis permease subunit